MVKFLRELVFGRCKVLHLWPIKNGLYKCSVVSMVCAQSKSLLLCLVLCCELVSHASNNNANRKLSKALDSAQPNTVISYLSVS